MFSGQVVYWPNWGLDVNFFLKLSALRWNLKRYCVTSGYLEKRGVSGCMKMTPVRFNNLRDSYGRCAIDYVSFDCCGPVKDFRLWFLDWTLRCMYTKPVCCWKLTCLIVFSRGEDSIVKTGRFTFNSFVHDSRQRFYCLLGLENIYGMLSDISSVPSSKWVTSLIPSGGWRILFRLDGFCIIWPDLSKLR